MRNVRPNSKYVRPLSYDDNGTLYFDGKRIEDIAKNKTTPFYLYSQKTIEYNVNEYKSKAKQYSINNPLFAFAMKSNNNLELLKLIGSLGIGADIVSIGELKRAREASIQADKILFSGVGKTDDEIAFTLRTSPDGIYSFNVESKEELYAINRIASEIKTTARVAFRLNPNVETKTHKHISTGGKTHKFGISGSEISELVRECSKLNHVKVVGLSIHIGSQLTDLSGTKSAIEILCKLALDMRPLNLEFLDVGGGFGVPYRESDENSSATLNDYMKLVSEATNNHFYSKIEKSYKSPRVVFEPGRSISATAGVLVTKVVRTKKTDTTTFLILDAGMNDLIRPAIYDAYHEIYPAKLNEKLIAQDVVGPICESTDVFARSRLLPPLSSGDIVVIADSGAYGRTMSSTYNMRELPPEYLL